MRTANQTCLGLGVALALAGAAACNFSPARTCSQDSDCPSGSCDTSLGVCVFYPPDAGDGGLCSPGCNDWQQCIGGACFNRYTGLRIMSPDTGAIVGSVVPVNAFLTATSGFTRNDPAALVFSGACQGGKDTAQLALQAPGQYAGTWNPTHEGFCQLTAAWPDAGLFLSVDAGILSPTVGVIVDKTPPSFVMTVQTSPYSGAQADPQAPGAWRRDDLVTVTVSSDEPHMNPSTVKVQLLGTDGDAGPLVAVDAGTSCGIYVYCGTAQVDVSVPAMAAFRTSLPIVATGTDVAGNTGNTMQGGDAGLSVTRWRWQFDTGTLATASSPAVGGGGTVYLGTNQPLLPTLFAVNTDGSLKWSFDAGTVVGSASVGGWDGGNESAYFPVNQGGNQAALIALAADGTLRDSCPFAGAQTAGSLAVGTTDAGGAIVESAFGVINNVNAGTLVAFRAGAGAGSNCFSTTSVNNIVFPGGVATNGPNVYFGDDQGNIQAFTFKNSWQAISGWPVAGRYAHALALGGNNLFAGNAAAPGPGGVYSLDQTSAAFTWSYPDGGQGKQAWNPSIASNGDVLYGSDDKTLTRIPFLGSTPSAQHAGQSALVGAPVVGNDKLIYTADSSNALTAFDGSLNPLWTLPIGGIQSSLTIDCSRDASGAKRSNRPGTLYMTTSDGKLDAFIVDSRSIDTSAPWPMYQHDPRHTGNSTTSLTEFACP